MDLSARHGARRSRPVLPCQSLHSDADDVRLFRVLCVALAPLAVLLLLERYTTHNYFSVMGGSGEINIRDGHVRAYGPLGHSILAGTVGATCVPMALCPGEHID